MQKKVHQFAAAEDWSSALLYQIGLSLDELATNIVNYGQEEGQVHSIGILIVSEPDSVTVEISDNGIAFDPLQSAATPDLDSPLAARTIGGLGIHMVRSMMDEMYYRREGGKNLLTLVKRRAG